MSKAVASTLVAKSKY